MRAAPCPLPGLTNPGGGGGHRPASGCGGGGRAAPSKGHSVCVWGVQPLRSWGGGNPAARAETAPGTGPPTHPAPAGAEPGCPPHGGGGGPGPPLGPPGRGRAGSAGSLVYIAGNEAIGARDFPATCSPPSHPGLAPGLRGGGCGGTGPPRPAPHPPPPHSPPPALAGALSTLGGFARSSGGAGGGHDLSPGGSPVQGGPRSHGFTCSRGSPVPAPGVPRSPREPGPGGAPVPERGGAVQGRAARRGPGGGGPGGCGRRCRRSRGPGPRRGPAGLPRAGAERPQVGAARPGRLRAAHGADRHPGEPVPRAGPGAGTGTGGRTEQGGPG